MNFFQLFLIYAVCWWLVLFMVLPVGVRVPEKPEPGHAASAPLRPRIRRRLLITSVITLFVTLAIWGVDSARAASGIYHAGSNDCAEPADLAADPSINAEDKDATLDGQGNSQFEQVPTFLDAPASDYVKNPQFNQQFNGGVVQMGVVTTDTRTGETKLNGQPIGNATTKPAHCK